MKPFKVALFQLIAQILKGVDQIMETMQTIKAALDDLKKTAADEKKQHEAEKAEWEAAKQDALSKLGALQAEFDLLKSKGEASQAELDALGVSITEAKAAVSDIVNPAAPQVPPVE